MLAFIILPGVRGDDLPLQQCAVRAVMPWPGTRSSDAAEGLSSIERRRSSGSLALALAGCTLYSLWKYR